MKSTLALLGLFALLLIPTLASAQMTSQEYDQLGQAVYQKGLYDKAVVYFQQATQADPTNAQAFEDLGNAYMKQGNQSQALQAYQQSLQLNPNNTTLKVMVDNMNSANNTAAPAQAQNEPANPQMEQSPAQETIVIHRRRPRPQPEPVVNYNDNLAPMDHARVWTKFEFGYNYSLQGDLTDSATNVTNENSNGTLAAQEYGFTNGSASMPLGGLMLGGELGFLIDPNEGIAIGVRYLQANDYNYSASNSAPSSFAGYPSDFWATTLTPYAVPFTLDYYLFLPDHNGRFFITAGAGYYAGTVQVQDNFSVVNYTGDTTQNDNPNGDLTAGNIGFEFGIGRDFAINRNFGISVFARGRYAKITQFQGTLSDGQQWVLAKFSDGSVDICDPSQIGSHGISYATVDFTGFDIGASLNFYSF